MKTIGTLLLAALAVSAQSLTLTGPASARAGSPITLTLTLAGATTTGPAALQWTLGRPTGLTLNPTVGVSASGAAKSATCSSNSGICLSYGMNQNIFANGEIARFPFTVPANATTPITFSLSNVVGTTRTGTNLPVTAGASVTVTISTPQDINGDGTVNATDVDLMANQVTGGTCTNDQNADGKCDVNDIFLVVLRALGVVI